MTERILKLAAEGPFKHEPTKRRLRGLLGGKWVFDTLAAEYVWEHAYYPLYYVPLEAIKGEIRDKKPSSASTPGFWTATLGGGEAGPTVEMTVFETGALKGLVKLAGDSLDWYSEDEKLLGNHPKDPYKRVECLPSSRRVRIEVDGVVVADSTNSVFLYETMLRARYYLSPSAVDWSVLTPSTTTTFCPYKGEAHYYHLKVGEREIKDAVWYYDFPLAESAQIQGRLSFYNEKVDVFIDGVKE